jgi:tetratricopeptide (TPR) repeat protein
MDSIPVSELCLVFLPSTLTKKQDPDARKLAEKLDGLPLALATAGAYLHQVSTSFAEYLQMYDASWLRLQQMTPQLLSYEDRALYSTWNISLENVKQRSEVAAKLLQLWAYFDNQDMSWELLWTGRGGSPEWFLQLTKDQLSFDAAIRVLCDHALVEADAAIRIGGVEHRGCSMHSCVHAWTNHVANPRFNEDLAKLALICVAFHASSAMRVANERGDGEVVRLDWTLVEKYASSVDTESRWVMELRVLRHADRCRNFIADVLGRQDDDLFITTALQNLGSVYRHQRKLDEAEEMFQRALECEEKALGPDNISTLNSALKVGILNEERGNLQKAENMYMRALKGFEKTLGPDNEATFDTISHLASIYGSKGKLDKEEEMYKRALKGKEKVLGHDDISTITTVINMATFYHRQGQLDQAGKMYRRASDAFKDKQKRDRHVELYLFIQFNIARFFGEQGQISGATRLLKSLHDIAQGKLGPNHELTSHVVSKLGSLYVHQGRLDEAEQMYNSVLGIQERVLGSDHTSTLETTRCLGNVYERQSKVDRAEEMYNRVLKGDNGAFRLDRKVALDTVNNLGEFYRHQHKLNEAEELYKQVLNDYKNLFELDRESVLTTVNNLGTIYIYQERFDEAEAMLKLALKGREEAHGSDHELTLHSVHNLGSLYIAWHKPDNMEVVLERALKGRIGVLGPNHASTIETVNNLDVFYTRQGRPDEARLMYERALKECSDPDRVRTGR